MRKTVKIIVGLVVAVIVLAAGLVLPPNWSQPSEDDRNVASTLVQSAKKAITPPQEAYFAAGRGLAIVNVYGVMDTTGQEKVLEQLRRTLQTVKYDGHARVSFFPPREFVVGPKIDGRQESTLKKSDPIRQVELKGS